MITTNSKKFYNIIKKIRNLGSDKKFMHNYVGLNSRLDSIQALVLNRKIKNLDNLNKKRQKIAKIYLKKIINKKITKLNYSKNCVFHQYVILTKKRNKLINLFKKNKIQYGLHYPKTIYQLSALKKYFGNQKLKNSEIIANNGISIPIDPNLKKNEINKIIKVINNL